jgi:hypothetical protein
VDGNRNRVVRFEALVVVCIRIFVQNVSTGHFTYCGDFGSLALGDLLSWKQAAFFWVWNFSADFGATAIPTSDWSYVHVSKCAQRKHNNGFCRHRVRKFKALVDIASE